MLGWGFVVLFSLCVVIGHSEACGPCVFCFGSRIGNLSPQQVRLPQITGRYGITCGQVLAAACAVMDGAPTPSGNDSVSRVVRGRIEGGNGSAAAGAFLEATRGPYGTIARAVYPVSRSEKTPVDVHRSWCRLRGGPGIELCEARWYLGRRALLLGSHKAKVFLLSCLVVRVVR